MEPSEAECHCMIVAGVKWIEGVDESGVDWVGDPVGD